MKSFSTQLVSVTAALFFFVGTVTAFTQNSLVTNMHSTESKDTIATRSWRISTRSKTRLYYEEESEWYSPPPTEAVKSKEETEAVPTPAVVKLPRGVKPKTTTVKARIELDEFLAQDDRLCVVKFHAAWCKSCQKFGLHFNKLAAHYADWEKDGQIVKQNPVRIATVEWGANLELCKALGVTKLPAVYFYSGGMKIDGFAVGPSRFAKVQDAVQRYASMTPEQLQFEAKLEQGKKLMEEAARRERFEEAAKARELRRRARTTPPREQLRRSRTTATTKTSSSSSSDASSNM